MFVLTKYFVGPGWKCAVLTILYVRTCTISTRHGAFFCAYCMVARYKTICPDKIFCWAWMEMYRPDNFICQDMYKIHFMHGPLMYYYTSIGTFMYSSEIHVVKTCNVLIM